MLGARFNPDARASRLALGYNRVVVYELSLVCFAWIGGDLRQFGS
jgi:hypothetical protein